MQKTSLPRLPATPLMTGWKRAMLGNRVITRLRMVPPRLEMSMAERTGLHPSRRIPLVSLFSPAILIG